MEKAKFIEYAYKPFCNSDDINRIFNVKNSEDYLLKLRAETVVEDMRLFRVIRNRYIKNGKTWDFTRHFSTYEFEEFLKHIPNEFSEKANLTQGFIFSNEAYGCIMRTDYGDIICISEALRYFLFYMNLSFLDFRIDVPDAVRYRSLIIGIRTMLKSETLDFEQDPRGLIPKELEKANNDMVSRQLQFIIGHEFSHHFLGHLNRKSTIKKGLFRMFKNEIEAKEKQEFYNHSQQAEFEADKFTLGLLKKTEYLDNFYVQGAISFFGYLDIYESVSDYIFPPSGLYKTHPSPESRCKRIIDDFKEFTDSKFIETFLESIKEHKKLIMDDIGFEIEKYEMYGSHYLAEPNSKWRGKELIDKVDYY
jgi:hypothetical protein